MKTTLKKANYLIPALGILLIAWGLWKNNPSKFFYPQQSKEGETCFVVEGSIYDGDTLRVDCAGTISKVRLCGIDAPEKAQPMGIEARDKLRSLIPPGGEIEFYPVETDRYGRTVAEIFVTGEPEIMLNAEMVSAGFAYHYAQYSGNCPNGKSIEFAETEAKEQRRGVWASTNAVKPWEFRRKSTPFN
jgi:endonuclease YncB( thermonuclease family)